MSKTEQQQAQELEQRIAAQRQGKPLPPASDLPEADLAADLITLAERTRPDPAFVAALEAQLKARASQLEQQKTHTANQPSFWATVSQLIKEGFAMKEMKYALGVAAVLLVGLAAFLIWNRNNPSPGTETPMIAESAEMPDVAETESASEDAEPGTAVAELPALPRLQSGQAAAGGLGGGGDAAALPAPESAVAADANVSRLSIAYGSPFSGTTFTLNGTLPTEPAQANVLQQPTPSREVDAATAQALAAQFGFTGTVYTEVIQNSFPETLDGPDVVPFEPPVIYHAFDGSRTLYIDPWGVYYNNYTEDRSYDDRLPFEQAAPIVEQFLQNNSLLTFPYEIQQGFGDDIHFVRLIDGRPINQPEIVAGVASDGEILFINYQLMVGLEDLGQYPLISAEAAWQRIQEGVADNNIPFNTFPADFGEQPEVLPVEPDFGEYQYWPRTYGPGSEVHLYDWPQIYQPVDGNGDPLIQVRGYTIQADTETLNAIVADAGSQFHLWGQLSEDGRFLQLAGWEKLPLEWVPISDKGVIQRRGDKVYFQGESGNIYLLPDAPADLPDGLEVTIFGWNTRDVGDTYPALDWESIDKYIEFPEDAPVSIDPVTEEPAEGTPVEGAAESTIIEDMPIDPIPFEPFHYEQVTLETVELAYYVTYLYPEMEGDPALMRGSVDEPTVIIQPTWKFSGTAENGDRIELFVQAVIEELLQQ